MELTESDVELMETEEVVSLMARTLAHRTALDRQHGLLLARLRREFNGTKGNIMFGENGTRLSAQMQDRLTISDANGLWDALFELRLVDLLQPNHAALGKKLRVDPELRKLLEPLVTLRQELFFSNANMQYHDFDGQFSVEDGSDYSAIWRGPATN